MEFNYDEKTIMKHPFPEIKKLGACSPNGVYRTKDFKDWYVGYYNPILIPSNDDRKISKNAADLNPELLEKITTTGFISNNSDVDMCDFCGKVYINYLCGNQLGFYYMAEAEYDGTVADLLKSYFE